MVKRKRKTRTQVAKAPSAAPKRFVLKEIALASIQDEGDGREDAGDIKALADSIRRRGLLQPIVVFRSGLARVDSFVMGAGRRRVAAARLLKWKTIPARVFPAASQEIREAVSAAENLDRQELSPVEEALMVARLAEALGVQPINLQRGAASSMALEQTAALLGRSVAWVKQRATLVRLCPEVRKLVALKRLPLAQAQEIAKLASNFDQTAVANAAVGDWDWMRDRGESRTEADGVRVQSVAEVRANVASRLSKLRGVPWKPDISFAGRPACATCPDNSANSLLFGIDKEDPTPEAKCLNTRCYDAKMLAAEKAVREAVKKGAEDKTIRATAAGVRDLVPEYVKAATVARQLMRRREPPKPRTRAEGATAVKVPWDKTPEGRLHNAQHAWRDKMRKRLGVVICKTPMRLACLFVGLASPTYIRHIGYAETPSKAVRRKIDPILKRIAGGTAKDLQTLAKGFSAKTVIATSTRVPLWVGRRLAGLLSITLDPEPKLEDFLPAGHGTPAVPGPAAAGEPKAVAKKKGRKAKARGRKGTKG